MNEKENNLLKPIYAAVERLVPTNRVLINMVNEKALGEGMKRSIYKVKFLDKAERSTKQLSSITLSEFKKHLKEIKMSDAEAEIMIKTATDILQDAEKQVEKVYGEVRRYVITSEIRTDCVKHNFRKIPSLNEAQNEIISKEIFSLAIEFINKSEKSSLDDVEEEFNKINHIALTLFNLVDATKNNTVSTQPKKKKPEKSSGFGIFDRFF